MNDNHLDDVLSCCPYYDQIINYNVKADDEISRNLINYYEDFVFLNFNNEIELKELDLILYKYIKDVNFYKFIQDRFKKEGDVLPLFDELKGLYNEFKELTLQKAEPAIWI